MSMQLKAFENPGFCSNFTSRPTTDRPTVMREIVPPVRSLLRRTARELREEQFPNFPRPPLSFPSLYFEIRILQGLCLSRVLEVSSGSGRGCSPASSLLGRTTDLFMGCVTFWATFDKSRPDTRVKTGKSIREIYAREYLIK